jgi:hypothetical protein
MKRSNEDNLNHTSNHIPHSAELMHMYKHRETNVQSVRPLVQMNNIHVHKYDNQNSRLNTMLMNHSDLNIGYRNYI